MGTLNVTSTSNGIMEQLRSALSDQFSAIAPFELCWVWCWGCSSVC